MKRQRKKMSRFWLVYTIVTVVLVIGVFAGLVLFYDVIDAFEESQPQSPSDAAKSYALALTEAEVAEMLNAEADRLTWSSEESRNRTVQSYLDSFKKGGVFCRRVGGTDSTPVYSVIAQMKEICRIQLKKAPTGRYGFDAWSVLDRYVTFEGFNKYTINVPSGSVISVNGKFLDDSYVTEKDIPYSTNPLEAGVQDLPTAIRYETDLLDAKPVVTVTYKEEPLEVICEDSTFTAKYPKSLMFSAKVKVPVGAVVSVGGVDIAKHYTKESESAFGGLIAEGLTVPSFDVYTIEGLYAPLSDVSVNLNGSSLEFNESAEGTLQNISVDIGSITNTDIADFADKFVRAYFHYTSQGYRNTDANLAAALAYVLNPSELYTRIRDSKVGYDFVTPVTSQVYNRLELVRMYQLEDGSYVVMLAFDVDHQIYSESRSYKGELNLHIVNSGGYKVANMVIDNE